MHNDTGNIICDSIHTACYVHF